MNERKPQKDQEAAPFLFFDGESETSFFEDEEVEGEYYSSSLEWYICFWQVDSKIVKIYVTHLHMLLLTNSHRFG